MQAHIQCLRCSKAIPIGPEMVGQVILCPSCMDRVYVSSNLLAAERSRSESAAPAHTPTHSFAADVLTNVLARMRPQGSEGAGSLGIVLAAGGAVAVLVLLAVGLVALNAKPAQETTEGTETTMAANSLPAKTYAPPPVLPPPTFQPVQPAITPRTGLPPTAASARAWTIRASAGFFPGASASTGSQQAGAALWPEVWRLPDIASSTDHLLPSPGDVEAGLKVSLNAAAADFPPQSGIAIVPDMEPGTRLPAGVRDPVATLRLEGPDLVFSWAGQGDARLASQFANCLLEIHDGKRKRVVQLREPARAEPIAIDLSLDKQQVETPIENPPRAGALQLEVTELIGFPNEARLRGNIRTTVPAISQSAATMSSMTPGIGMSPFAGMPIAGRVTIEFPDIPGFEIQVSFKPENGKVVVSVDPTFLDDGKEGEVSLRRISQIEEDARRPLPNAQRDLDSAERSLKLWSEKLKESNANEPPSTSRRFPAWRLKHMEATRNVASFEKGVADLNARVDKSKSRLDVATKLRAFLKDSNNQATIHYVVYSECGETDLLLIDGRGR